MEKRYIIDFKGFSNFKAFMEYCNNEADKIGFSNSPDTVVEVFQRRALEVETLETESEIEDFKKDIEGAIASLKNNMRNTFLANRQQKATYQNSPPEFFSYAKMLSEYRILLDKISNEKGGKEKVFDPNHFNEYTFSLFKYLVEKYKKKGKIKYINIWYFLRRDYKPKNKIILFNYTQSKYKAFIKKEYHEEIRKFEKSDYKYEDTELGIMRQHAKDYENMT